MAGKRPEKKKSKIAKEKQVANGNGVSSDSDSDSVGHHPEPIDIDTPTPPPPQSPAPVVSVPPQDPRTRLRARWELSSVLNFLRVFKPLIQSKSSKLEISATEIETALINPNQDLSELHISLLKGIPPVSKNLSGPDAWVPVLYKKLAPWWPWVAEGEIPLKASHGEEIPSYRELDPVNRLVILKSLCEVRALQDDFVSYISDALKQGTDIRTFRKERICGDSTGIAYWNDGDEVLGYRLYREVTKVDYTPRKVKGRLTEPPNGYQWETLATNLEEFQEISDKFSSSEIVAEATVGEIVKNEIIPILEEIQKKKERALKRQQKQVTLLNGYLNSHPLGVTRSCRNRKPVKYTFDEYDKTIEEAIQLTKKRKMGPEPKQGKKGGRDEGGKHVDANGNANGNSIDNVVDEDTDEDDDKFRGGGGGSESDRGDNEDSESDRGDEDYDDKSSGESENDKEDHDNETEEEDHDNGSDEEDQYTETDEEDQDNERKNPRTRANGHSLQKNSNITRDVASVRRSKRVTGNGDHHVKMQKHSSDTADSDPETIPDSDDSSSSESPTDNISGAGKESLDVLDGLPEESESEENENDSAE